MHLQIQVWNRNSLEQLDERCWQRGRSTTFVNSHGPIGGILSWAFLQGTQGSPVLHFIYPIILRVKLVWEAVYITGPKCFKEKQESEWGFLQSWYNIQTTIPHQLSEPSAVGIGPASLEGDWGDHAPILRGWFQKLESAWLNFIYALFPHSSHYRQKNMRNWSVFNPQTIHSSTFSFLFNRVRWVRRCRYL